MFLSTLIFTAACILIIFAGGWVVSSLSAIARYLGWKEFVVAFFAFSLGAVAPEFFIGVTSAFHGIPELSLGNIIGQNILLLSLTVAISAFILKDGIKIESQTVKIGSTFAIIVAILPMFLLLDGELSRIDGIILISTFIIFTIWLFSRKERFTKIYSKGDGEEGIIKGVREFFKNCLLLIAGLFLIVVAAEGIIRSSLSFSEHFAISIPFVGLLIVAIGTGLPETYIAANLARRGQSWMILGGLMGAVALSSTLVLGVVSIIHPISASIADLPNLALARIFLLISAVLFLFFVRTGRRISNKEALVLFIIYLLFVILSFLIS